MHDLHVIGLLSESFAAKKPVSISKEEGAWGSFIKICSTVMRDGVGTSMLLQLDCRSRCYRL